MERAWVRGCLALGFAATLMYFAAPAAWRATIFVTLNVGTVVAIVVGIRRHRPLRSQPWAVLVAGYTVYIAGDLLWFFGPPAPSAADIFFFIAYGSLALGLALAVRTRGSGRDRGGFLDALIITIGAGVLSWVFIMSPQLQDPSLPLRTQLGTLAYPALDLLLLGTLVRQSFLMGGRRTFFGLLVLGILAQLAADTGYAIAVSNGTFTFGDPLMAGYLVSFTFVAAAALHPSMTAFTEEVSGGETPRRMWRLALLGGSALVAPAILISEALARSFEHVVPLAILSATLFLLVLARVGQLLSDLRERKQTEARLREAERNYRDLVEQLPGVVYTADPGPEGRWTYVSPQITELLGYTPEEWMDDPTLWAQRLHPDDRDRVVSAEETVLKQDSQQPHDEYRMVARDGRVVWVRDDATLIRSEGEESAFFRGLLFDITDRKVLEDQLRQSQKMEAIGLLAGGISHDFNNLLAIIRNYASFVAEEVPVTDPKHQDLQEVIRAATRGAQLTRQLLTFSRREVVQPRVLDLNEVVSDMHKMLSRTIPATVQLTTSLAPHLWRTRIDPGQIEQILMNLAVNAKDAMPGGGRVTIVTANAEIQTSTSDSGHKVPPGNYVTLSVADTGSGMSKQVLERIFEPFFTTKPQGQGTGLGLATVYGIVEQAGGHIVADSEVGRGTTFTVYLPRTDEGDLDQPEAGVRTPTGNGRGRVILVAEDEDAVRGLVVRILRKDGYTVLSAPNGVEAIRTAQTFRGRIDLLLSDVVMPDVSGREVSERTQLPTLYMSGYVDDILTDQGVDAPREALLEKPFSAEDLINAVRTALASHRAGAHAG